MKTDTSTGQLLEFVTEIRVPASPEVFVADEYFSVSKYPDRWCCEQEVKLKFVRISEMFKHYFKGFVEEGAGMHQAHTLRCFRLNRMCWNERPILAALGVMDECGDMEPFAKNGGQIITCLSAVKHLIDLSCSTDAESRAEHYGGTCFVRDSSGRTRMVGFGWSKEEWGYWRETTKPLFLKGFRVGASCLDNSCAGPCSKGSRFWVKV